MNQMVLLIIGVLLTYSAYATVDNFQLRESFDNLSGKHESLFVEHTDLVREFESIRDDLERSHLQYDILLQNYSETQIIYASPEAGQSIVIWTIEVMIDPNRFVSWNLLDTFINQIEIQTTGTVKVVIVDLDNYVKLRSGLRYDPIYNQTGTQFSTTQRISQGCATYVLVIFNQSDSPVRIVPNVTATYAPTPFLTGVCAL